MEDFFMDKKDNIIYEIVNFFFNKNCVVFLFSIFVAALFYVLYKQDIYFSLAIFSICFSSIFFIYILLTKIKEKYKYTKDAKICKDEDEDEEYEYIKNKLNKFDVCNNSAFTEELNTVLKRPVLISDNKPSCLSAFSNLSEDSYFSPSQFVYLTAKGTDRGIIYSVIPNKRKTLKKALKRYNKEIKLTILY